MKRVLASALFVGVLMVCQSAFGQVVPFKSVGTGNEYNPSTQEYGGPGITAHMGKSTGSGVVTDLEQLDDLGLVFAWTTVGEFVGANGDKMFYTGSGVVTFVPIDFANGIFTASWDAGFEIVGGTGRFENARTLEGESLDVLAINDPFQLIPDGNGGLMPVPGDIWTYGYEITGRIDLGKKKK